MFLKTTRGWTDIRQEQLDISPSGLPDLKEVLDVGYVNTTAGDLSLSRGKRGTFEYLYDVFTRQVICLIVECLRTKRTTSEVV